MDRILKILKSPILTSSAIQQAQQPEMPSLCKSMELLIGSITFQGESNGKKKG